MKKTTYFKLKANVNFKRKINKMLYKLRLSVDFKYKKKKNLKKQKKKIIM